MSHEATLFGDHQWGTLEAGVRLLHPSPTPASPIAQRNLRPRFIPLLSQSVWFLLELASLLLVRDSSITKDNSGTWGVTRAS